MTTPVPDEAAVDALASLLRSAYAAREGVDIFQVVAAGLIVLGKKVKIEDVTPIMRRIEATEAAEKTDAGKDLAIETAIKDLTARIVVLEKSAPTPLDPVVP